MRQRNWSVGVIVVLLVLVGGYFFIGSQRGPAQDTIQLGSFSKAIDYAPYLVARNQGWFEEVAAQYGMSVNYTEFQSLAPINEAFATGDVDLVFEAEAPAIVGKAANIPLKIVHSGVNLTQEIIVQPDSTISSVRDLRGKKIAVLAGTSSHQGVSKVLKENGLHLSDVEIIDMTPPDAKAAFETGQVDAWAIWPPFPQQELLAGKGKNLSGSEVFIQSITVMREKFVIDNPKLAMELLAVIERAQKWIADNPKKAQQIVADELDLELAVVEESWPAHDFQPVLGPEEIKDIQDKADFLSEIGLIKRQVNVERELVDTQ